jgi:putative peptidoglycan lipid II flippase
VFITVVTTMIRVVCQAEERFGSIAVSTMAGPATALVVMLVLWSSLGLEALAIGNIAGALATLGLLVAAAARASAVPIPRIRPDPRLADWARHAAPLTLSGGILEIRGIADRAVASLLGPGSVSALRYSMVLIQPLTAIGPAWSSVIYPRLVQSTLGAPGGSLASWADRMMRTVVGIFLPIAALTAAVAPVAVFVAYGRGAFTTGDLRLTATTMAAYTPIIVTVMLLPVLVGSHNARRRGSVLLLGGALNVVLNVVLDVVLGFLFGAPGIALSTAAAEVVVVSVFIRILARSGDAFDPGPLLRSLVATTLAIAPIALVIGALAWTGFGTRDTLAAIATLAGMGIVGVSGYTLIAARLGVSPAEQVVRSVLDRVAVARSDRPRL